MSELEDLDDNADIYSDNESIASVYNQWTEDNIKTVKTWKISTEYDAYIYKRVLQNYKKLLNRAFKCILILTTFSTIINSVAAALGIGEDPTYRYAVIAINILLAILSAIATAITGWVKIEKWDETVTNISTYLTKLDNFYSTIINQLVLDDKLRMDATEFIKKESTNYINIKKDDPDITPGDYRYGKKGYEKHLKENHDVYNITLQYQSNDAINMV